MNRIFYSLLFLLVLGCGQSRKDQKKENPSQADTGLPVAGPGLSLQNTAERKILWRASQYDETLKDTISKIVINDTLVRQLSDSERAAIGYIATFVGNECDWDGPYNDNRDNLKCKILTALDLGYQCSDKHLSFLKQWFKDDKAVLTELTGCPTTPEGATVQDTFDELSIHTKGDHLTVSFKVSGYSMRENQSWSWTEKDHFQRKGNTIICVKKEKSKVILNK